MMKSVLLAGGFSLFLLGGSACMTFKKSGGNASRDSRNTLNWTGTYKGVLPCADCEGIETIVHLDGNLTYQVSTQYLGKSKEVSRQEGTFSWSKDGSMITLNRASNSEAAARFKVSKDQLISLDTKGNPIEGALAAKYMLQKEAGVITEKYWKLLSLAGKSVAPPAEGQREAHFTLKTSDNRVQGNGGCNTLFGTYKLAAGSQISFSGIGSTRMACVQPTPEADFIKALETANRYTLSGEDTLVLSRDGEAPLAKFAAVYMQ
jgi:heat shock protein HslJ